jgi:hypothetical protein
MNFKTKPYLPHLDLRGSKTSLKNMDEPKKPLNFISFDDSEIFCDVAPPKLSDVGQKPPQNKTNRTLAVISTGRALNRKGSEGRLQSIVLGSKMNMTRVEDKKSVNTVSHLVRLYGQNDGT